METRCNAAYLDSPMLGRREILADFDGGDITSGGGALLLRQTEQLPPSSASSTPGPAQK
jgi:hypothetical protein